MKRPLAAAAALLLVVTAGCTGSRKSYPEPLPGWHNADYSVLFGRLQRVLARNPDDPPVWVIRFGLAQERFGGELALTPASRLIGYTGGEQVEIHGQPRQDLGFPNYAGTWYEVSSIRMWQPHR